MPVVVVDSGTGGVAVGTGVAVGIGVGVGTGVGVGVGTGVGVGVGMGVGVAVGIGVGVGVWRGVGVGPQSSGFPRTANCGHVDIGFGTGTVATATTGCDVFIASGSFGASWCDGKFRSISGARPGAPYRTTGYAKRVRLTFG